MKIKNGNRIKIEKRQSKLKSVQVKAIHVCLKGKNVQRAMFSWNAEIT